MNRPHLICGLRIAWSVAFVSIGLLIEVLWSRSYSHIDVYDQILPSAYALKVTSFGGELRLSVLAQLKPKPAFKGDITHATRWETAVPHLLALIVVAACAALPWIRPTKSFSLRTLLVATTLIAVVLGLVVWSSS